MRHFLEHSLMRYRHTYRGTIIGGILLPLFFLASLGVGVGSMVDTQTLGPGSYLDFVGPALLATAAMQIAANESLWPTLTAVKWDGTYEALLATPLGATQLALGHVAWIGLRVFLSSVLFTGVLVAFGIGDSIAIIGAPFAAALMAVTHASVISAWSATRETDATFPLILRLIIVPMFLFSGAFFPVDQLPAPLQPMVTVFPIWHGVELCRDLADGRFNSGTSIHVLYPVGVAAAGAALFTRVIRGRLAV